MTKTILCLVVLFSIVLLNSCNKSNENDKIFQVSLLQGLTFGDYNGSVKVKHLKQNGNFGIGTFDKLNGELVMLDNTVYRVLGSGAVEVANYNDLIPFSNVTHFDIDEEVEVDNINSFDSLTKMLDEKIQTMGNNYFYAIQIDGEFNTINLRSEYSQNEPYEPLAKVLETDQTFFDYENIKGSIVGFYLPPYMGDLNATGYHFHFISEDRKKGGHVLNFNIKNAKIKYDFSDKFEMLLPQNDMFNNFDLTIDQSADIEKVEKNN